MRRISVLAGLLAAVLGLAVFGAAGARAASHTAAPPPVAISVAPKTLTRPLPQDFLGLAFEYTGVPGWVYGRHHAGAVDPLLVSLIRNLTPHGRPSIRIGGQSQDREWWPVPGLTTPIGVTHALSAAWTAPMKALASAVDARLLLGLNIEAQSDPIAVYEAKQLIAGVGLKYIQALEIGNEPDLYLRTPWYRLLNGQVEPWYSKVGTRMYSRKSTWGPEQFVAEVKHLIPSLPHVPIAGPDAASARWIGPFTSLASRGGRIAMLDSHRYPLEQCVTNPKSPKFPSIPNLLKPYASRQILDGSMRYVALAHRIGIPFRIDEMGSVTCTGTLGVSNTMAAGLWVTDALFSAARGNADGVNLHTFPNSKNGLFDLSDSTGQWNATIHPLYDGVLMFARADPPGARLLALDNSNPGQVRTWSTMGADHQVRVLLINDGGATSARIRPPAGYGSHPAGVVRMLAPSVSATSGVTIGGQALGGTSVVPTPALAMLAPGHDGRYTIPLPAYSETELTLAPRAAAGPH